MIYQDECPFRANVWQDRAWVKTTDPSHGYNTNHKTGVGLGWNVSAFLSEECAVLCDDDEEGGSPWGYLKKSQDSTKSGKETSTTFLKQMKEVMLKAKARFHNKTVVFVLDGAGTHKTMEEGAWKPRKYNLGKKNENHTHTLQELVDIIQDSELDGLDELLDDKGKEEEEDSDTILSDSEDEVSEKQTRSGRRVTGHNYRNLAGYDPEDPVASRGRTRGDGGNVLTKREALDIILRSDHFARQKLAVQRLAEDVGGGKILVLFLPCAHPVLNPIEKVWRAMKSNLVRINGVTQKGIENLCHTWLSEDGPLRGCDEGREESRLDRMFMLVEGYRRFFFYMDHHIFHSEEETAIRNYLKVEGSDIPIPSERRIKRMMKEEVLAKIPDDTTSNIRRWAFSRGKLKYKDVEKYLHRINKIRVTREVMDFNFPY